jgi:hypothetical protein
MGGGSSDRAKGSVGNTRPTSKGWGAAEGLATDGKTAEFCDGIADWWPDVSFFLHTLLFFYSIVMYSTLCPGLDQARRIPRDTALQQGPGWVQDV